jgi:hypothetical protein
MDCGAALPGVSTGKAKPVTSLAAGRASPHSSTTTPRSGIALGGRPSGNTRCNRGPDGRAVLDGPPTQASPPTPGR